MEGIAMGSPLGPLFADIYVNYLESKLKRRLEQNGVIYWKRFVDDVFMLVNGNADIDIQFTVEKETNNSLPFLDTLITRTTTISDPDCSKSNINTNQSEITIDKTPTITNSFTTSIYRKPTFPGLLLKWNSFVPHSYKVSAIGSMIYRAIKIFSSYSLMHNEFEFIQNLAVANGYPLKFVQNQIRKTLDRHFEESKISTKTSTKSNEIENNGSKKEQICIDVLFIGNETKILGKKIFNLAKNIRPDLHIQPIPRPPPAITTLFTQKDKIPKDWQSNIVYTISCSECNENYIGKTIRQASRPHQEHGALQQSKPSSTSEIVISPVVNQELRRSDRIRGNPKINYCLDEKDYNDEFHVKKEEQLMKSALYKHHIEKHHQINWNDWKTISKDRKRYRLLVRESLQILHKQSSLNRTVCSIPLIFYPEGLSKPTVKMKLMTIDGPRAGTNS